MNRPSRVQVFVLDAKGYAFPPLAGLPHVQAVAAEPDAWLEQAAGVLVAMEARLRARERADDVHLVLVVDELVDLLMTDQERTGGGLAEALIRLTQKGREVGVHLIAATQKPSARVVNSLITSNLPCRLVGQVVSGTDAALASGQRASGAQHLPGRGTFIMVAGGTMDAMTAPYVRDGDVELVRRLVRGDQQESALSEPVAKATSRIIDAQAFLDKLRARAARMAPGRPAEPPPGDVIQHLVNRYYAGQGWPSRRAVQRMIAQTEGNKIASASRAEAALAQAQRSVQKAAMK
jgi:DNA segregation ATPase FtsK/SpoIIIE-like protein